MDPAKIPARRIRLATGLILYVYVTLHLLNLSLGLAGLDTLSEVGDLAGMLIGTTPGLILIYGALLVHIALALWSLYRRNRMRMPWSEAVQLVLGFLIPLLLAGHIVATRGAAEVIDFDTSYRVIQTFFWTGPPTSSLQQIVGLFVAWVHGCLGLHFWLRLKRSYSAFRAPLAAFFVAVPILALAGFIASGREVQFRIANDPAWIQETLGEFRYLPQADTAWMQAAPTNISAGLLGTIALTFVLRALRLRREDRSGRFKVQYEGGRTVTARIGSSVLDASKEHEIPHASVCGGRGRCSTCRVQLSGDAEAVAPPGEEEAKVLARVNAAPGVRLACQTRPRGDVKVTLLLPADAGPRAARRASDFREGDERVMTILFADLRGFTTLTEQKLPYDVVFLLNRFAREMGEAIERHGGRIDKFMGDGIMALFGLDTTPEQAARDALATANEMQDRLARMNRDMVADLPTPLRMGIGLHAGRVIVGEIGHGTATGITAVGDVVNTASRLEALTKEYKAVLIASQDMIDLAGGDVAGSQTHEIAVRGRSAPVRIHAWDGPTADQTAAAE
ncbi:MAG: adenylate/guanylate cyclase domain-containing protein [Pseudomonadota bacterium]